MRRKNLFVSILLNCFCPDGSINWTRTWRETRYLARFVSTLLLVLLLFFGICATPIVLLHISIVSTTIMKESDLEPRYETWTVRHLISQPITPFWKDSLRDTWYIWVAIALYIMFSFYLLVLKLFVKLFNHYKKKVFRREKVYSSRGINHNEE